MPPDSVVCQDVDGLYNSDGIVAFPFPLTDTLVVKLWLPGEGLTEEQGTRLKQYIDALILPENESAKERQP